MDKIKFDILTLFPEMFNVLNESIIGRAVEAGTVEINSVIYMHHKQEVPVLPFLHHHHKDNHQLYYVYY